MNVGSADLTLRPPSAFGLDATLLGHGWVDLAPHRWERAEGSWHTAFLVADTAVSARIRERRGKLAVAVQAAAPVRAEEVRRTLAHMLRFELDLEPFWGLCDRTKGWKWVRRRGAGRLLRSATVFEDLLKLLFTTNCSWSATRAMTRNLVTALGPTAPDGARAFPPAATCAEQSEAFWRDTVRAGYRARAARDLARAFAERTLEDEDFLSRDLGADVVRERLLALDGFGPYAAGQALRLFGHHEDLALDSWCRATWKRLRGATRTPTDARIARDYRSFGEWQGLALWMDLSAEWHREPRARRSPDR